MRLCLATVFLLLELCRGYSRNEFGCDPSPTRSRTVQGPICKGALIFEDNFDFLDFSKWSHQVTMSGGGNNEFQVYWEDGNNSFVENGNLRINPGKLADVYGEEFLSSGTIDLGERCTDDWNDGCLRTGDPVQILPPATSARLQTKSTFSFTFGQVEVRARSPAGDWLWPAIWLMPRDSVYGGWPVSGEIDIMESRGNRDYFRDGLHFGSEYVESTLHWGPEWWVNGRERTHWERRAPSGEGWDRDYHLYQMEWTPDSFTFSIDNVEMGTILVPDGGFWELGEFENLGVNNPWVNGTKMAPFDQEFFLILNVAVGGTLYFPDDATNLGGKPWSNDSPQFYKDFWDGRSQWEPTWWQDGSTNFHIDYVRVWAL